MPKQLVLRNRGPNADSAGDLYRDAVEILRGIAAVEGLTPKEEELRKLVSDALAILAGDLEEVK